MNDQDLLESGKRRRRASMSDSQTGDEPPRLRRRPTAPAFVSLPGTAAELHAARETFAQDFPMGFQPADPGYPELPTSFHGGLMPVDAHTQTGEPSQPIRIYPQIQFPAAGLPQNRSGAPSPPLVHGTEHPPASMETFTSNSTLTGLSGNTARNDRAPPRGRGWGSSSRQKSRTPSIAGASPAGPLISDFLGPIIKITKRCEQVIGTLGFWDDDAFQVWCERCVEHSFQLFFEDYKKLHPDYKRRLSKAERDTVASLACDAYKAAVREDPRGMLEGDLNRLELFARFAVDVMYSDNGTHAEMLNNSNFLCEQPVGFTQKIRGLVMLVQFLLDCRELKAKLSGSHDAVESESDDTGFLSPRENLAARVRQRELQAELQAEL